MSERIKESVPPPARDWKPGEKVLVEAEVDYKPYSGPCRKCKKENVVIYREWDSSCSGYTDYQMICKECYFTWWHEGSDS